MQLVDDIHLHLVRGGSLVEDCAHGRHVGASNCGGIRNKLQGAFQILARLHTGGDSVGRHGSCLAKAEGGALHRGVGVGHDQFDVLRRVAQAGQFRLSLLDSLQATEPLRERCPQPLGQHRAGLGYTDARSGAQGVRHEPAGLLALLLGHAGKFFADLRLGSLETRDNEDLGYTDNRHGNPLMKEEGHPGTGVALSLENG